MLIQYRLHTLFDTDFSECHGAGGNGASAEYSGGAVRELDTNGSKTVSTAGMPVLKVTEGAPVRGILTVSALGMRLNMLFGETNIRSLNATIPQSSTLIHFGAFL